MPRMAGYQNRSSRGPSFEDYPTQPWATRALLTHVIPGDYKAQTVWEPAANRGYMARPLAEFFGTVIATDLLDYGMGYPQIDFLSGPTPTDYGMQVDWIITNPPFNKADDFIRRALPLARAGVAMFGRQSFLEGFDRLENLFKPHPPTIFAPFAGRVPLVQGRVDKKAASQMPYAWFIWQHGADTGEPVVRWIPDCRKALTRDGDYDVFGTTPPELAKPEESK